MIQVNITFKSENIYVGSVNSLSQSATIAMQQWLKGAQGERGYTGPQGLPGIQGVKGEPGLKGDKGDEGAQGEKGEKGDRGERGVQGIPGVQGAKGDQGNQGMPGIQGIQGIQGFSSFDLAVKAGYIGTEAQFSAEQAAIANNSARLEAVEKRLPNVLPVTVTGTALAPVFLFCKEDFVAALQSYANGAQLFVDCADLRTAVNKPIDLSKRYNALWNKTLSQIEVSQPEVARGFYIDGEAPKNRGCVSGNTFKYIIRGAVFNSNTGFYELNGLTDITEGQINFIYSLSANSVSVNMSFLYQYINNKNCRTVFAPLGTYGGSGANIDQMFSANSYIEVVALNNIYISSAIYAFANCARLERVMGLNCGYITSPSKVNDGAFNSPSISELQIKNLRVSISLKYLLLIERDSILYLINHSANTTPIIVTLHPDALARLTEADIALASSKNITLAY